MKNLKLLMPFNLLESLKKKLNDGKDKIVDLHGSMVKLEAKVGAKEKEIIVHKRKILNSDASMRLR